MNFYSIADIIIGLEPKHALLRQRCEPYLCRKSGVTDYVISDEAGGLGADFAKGAEAKGAGALEGGELVTDDAAAVKIIEVALYCSWCSWYISTADTRRIGYPQC